MKFISFEKQRELNFVPVNLTSNGLCSSLYKKCTLSDVSAPWQRTEKLLDELWASWRSDRFILSVDVR